MKVIDNKFEKLGNDLKSTIKENSKLQICASIFSMYGFQSLKKELMKIDSLKFIFTDPTFVQEVNSKKETRMFKLDLHNREKSINGSEFEVRLKNELNGKAIAKECAKWIENKVKFKSNINYNPIDKFINIETKSKIFNKESLTTYLKVEEFNTVGFGYEKGNSLFTAVTKIDDNFEMSKYYLKSFDELWNDQKNFKDVTEEVINYITDLYKENSPEFIYYFILYNIFTEFLEDISEDEIANEKTEFKNSVIWNSLYAFQKDAVLGIINKLERHNGCILADSVGLGKTFTAKWYRPILTIIPLQLISYEVAKLKGNDIDKPKNLAKSVTVE